jgi:predicted dehydrogenase
LNKLGGNRFMENNPKVAVVGAGYWGKNLVRNFDAIGVLATICDAQRATLDALAKQYHGCAFTESYTSILNDPAIAAVAIASPAEMHYNMVKEALLAGKHVYVEKPLSLHEEEGIELHELAQKSQKILMVGHLLQYHPAVVKLKQLVSDGELGKIEYIYSNRLNLGKIRREENILWSFAPHDISVILSLAGEMPDRVTCVGANYLHQQVADVTLSSLSFASGIRAHIFVSWLHPYKEQKLVVVGDRKMALFNDVEPEDKLLLYPHRIEWKNHIPVPDKGEAEKSSSGKEGTPQGGVSTLRGLYCPELEAQNRRRGSPPSPAGASGMPEIFGEGRADYTSYGGDQEGGRTSLFCARERHCRPRVRNRKRNKNLALLTHYQGKQDWGGLQYRPERHDRP